MIYSIFRNILIINTIIKKYFSFKISENIYPKLDINIINKKISFEFVNVAIVATQHLGS